jgi:hypothetical protein
MLPSTFGSSIWFTEDELAELEGTTLHRATVMQRKSLQTLFDNKVKGLVGELLNVDESGRFVLISHHFPALLQLYHYISVSSTHA